MLYLVDGENINGIPRFEQTGINFNENDFIVLFKSQFVSSKLSGKLKEKYKCEVFEFEIESEGNNSMDRQIEVAIGVMSQWDLKSMGYNEICLLSDDKEFRNAKFMYDGLGLKFTFAGTCNRTSIVNEMKIKKVKTIHNKIYNMIVENIDVSNLQNPKNRFTMNKKIQSFVDKFINNNGDLSKINGCDKTIINSFIRGINQGVTM